MSAKSTYTSTRRHYTGSGPPGPFNFPPNSFSTMSSLSGNPHKAGSQGSQGSIGFSGIPSGLTAYAIVPWSTIPRSPQTIPPDNQAGRLYGYVSGRSLTSNSRSPSNRSGYSSPPNCLDRGLAVSTNCSTRTPECAVSKASLSFQLLTKQAPAWDPEGRCVPKTVAPRQLDDPDWIATLVSITQSCVDSWYFEQPEFGLDQRQVSFDRFGRTWSF